MLIQKVISGGQTGADQAGLFAAARWLIQTGGWAPRGWKTQNGSAQDMLSKFGLVESREDYAGRTRENVRDSDATIRFAVDFHSPGEQSTFNAIQYYGKPLFDVALPNFMSACHPIIPIMPDHVAEWLVAHNILILNVAGNTQGKMGYNIFGMVYTFLMSVFPLLYHK